MVYWPHVFISSSLQDLAKTKEKIQTQEENGIIGRRRNLRHFWRCTVVDEVVTQQRHREHKDRKNAEKETWPAVAILSPIETMQDLSPTE